MGNRSNSIWVYEKKLDTRSSTEAEVVGVDDMASDILWGFLLRIKDTMLKRIFCINITRVISS